MISVKGEKVLVFVIANLIIIMIIISNNYHNYRVSFQKETLAQIEANLVFLRGLVCVDCVAGGLRRVGTKGRGAGEILQGLSFAKSSTAHLSFVTLSQSLLCQNPI